MLILTIKTDQPLAEIALLNGQKVLSTKEWEAHRLLADTIHINIKELLDGQGKDWADIGGIVCFKGPGSFTGLRIGLSVANALAYGLNIPIVSDQGDAWRESGVERLLAAESETIAIPDYGGKINITTPKK
jgi:tRNA threonylcarbamoyladenosine biosynthesis protein TsaB